jgi:hypothetical protein
MCQTNLLRRPWIWPILVAGVVGCGSSQPQTDDRFAALDPKNLVPISGVVTVGGKPVASVVITFLPPSGAGVASGETDKDGKFELKSMGGPGAVPGKYKVTISYLVSLKGVPQGVGARATMTPGPDLLSAKELLPAEYSDLGRTTISFTVGPKGGEFNSDVPATLPAKEEIPPEKKPKDEHPTKDKKAAAENTTKDKQG